MHERDAGENASTPDSDAINISAEVCIGSSTTVGATMVPLAFAGVESWWRCLVSTWWSLRGYEAFSYPG